MSEVDNLTRRHSIFRLEIAGISMGLLPERALWIESLNTLLIADLHFGKAAHFRKSGIPIPEPIHDMDLIRLQKLHEEFRPVHTYFLGDLFHSDWNEQWTYLNEFLATLDQTQFHLIVGNHDVLSAEAYRRSVLKIHKEPFEIGPVILSHEPLKTVDKSQLNIFGHIHPGVRLIGKARQSVVLPCFYQTKNQLLLPAFGNFTGLARVRPGKQDNVWAIANGKIIPVLSGTSIG